MNRDYTVLSFAFGGYEKIRDPYEFDRGAEYVYVTDRESTSAWKLTVDERMRDMDPVYASYYVRYHPFEYSEADTVFVVDGSVQICDTLRPIYEEFRESGRDYMPMLTNYRDDDSKIEQWTRDRRLSPIDREKIRDFLSETGLEKQKGSIGSALIGLRRSPVIERLLYDCWNKLLELGHDGVPNRMDEVVMHKLLSSRREKISVYPVSVQIIQSTYMTYCCHGSQTPIEKYANYDQYYWLCGEPVYPARFDKQILYPREYRCGTEAMLLTKYLNPDDLREWLDWHLDRVKFDRIHVFDNESSYDVRAVCDEYRDRVSYEKIEGHPKQYRLYDGYVNDRSTAEWIMPIDDDEFLDIGEFSSVYEAVMHYRVKFPHMDMLAVRWKHLFPADFKMERNGKVLDYCVREDPELAKQFIPLGDGGVKTIVRRCGRVHYQETWENPDGGHVPVHSCFYGALLSNGQNVTKCGILNCPRELEDEKMRLLHCRYKGPSDWIEKYVRDGAVTVSDAVPRKKRFRFMEALDQILDGYSTDRSKSA